MNNNLTLQTAKALLALRGDELREVNNERKKLLAEIEMLEKFIKNEIDKDQMSLFEFLG